ncbi:ATP-binding protein [Streptomyces sp. DSM 42041]|uniref:ATP-binding protein n=1 Tax=Streptomyces hazeniae TaxID=3075538 RepID=A0ABU2NMP5_9ACTN|nr:ATP-binding protein [Streptomyces sp. DSM 42041]MDT0378254.1 ATP-binding protein [Streptomyces sp. DSM 42041]
MDASPTPVVSELRLSAFRAHRGRVLPLQAFTLLTGPSGSGKSSVLEAFHALGRLAHGDGLSEVFGDRIGGASSCVPFAARPDGQGRRGFRLGCTVDGPAGPVRLDLAVQAEPELRVAGERLVAADGRTLLSTAQRDPGRPSVQAEWHTAGSKVVRAPLPDDRLATALLPLRVAGTTEGQREVLAAVEQVVVALRSVFPCDPAPEAMRAPADLADGMLRSGCDNLAAVLRRTRAECTSRHAALVEAVRAGCAGPVDGLTAVACDGGRVRALLERGGSAEPMPVDRLGDGELRYLGLALVLLTGPGVLNVDPVEGMPPARQALAVLADGLDRGLDRRQSAELLALTARMCRRGHIRLLGTLHEAPDAVQVPEATLVDLGRERIPAQLPRA